MNRRAFLKTTGAVVATAGVAPRIATAQGARWRKFEVVTRIEVADPAGVTRAWVPVPLMGETDYFKRQPDSWTGNAPAPRAIHDPKYDLGMVYAEWPATEKAPVIEVVSRFSARDRALDVSRPPASPPREDKATLARYLEPTELIPVDGIVRETAMGITSGAKTDVDRARAIYEWVVENTFRDPKTRGCGLGDVKTMLETKQLFGKCADLNVLYVGLARAAGLPARDVYGVRTAESAEFKSLGKGGDITKAQHCRAEVYLNAFGWFPVDPADVRKVVLEEKPGLTLADPIVQRARAKLFGQWEMNWLAYNYGHDVRLPNSAGGPVAFFMYPQAETTDGRRDSLDPATFKYTITSKEL